MAVPKRRKCKSKACIRLNFLIYKKIIMLKKMKFINGYKIVKNITTFFKVQKYYLI
jgi:hypothetical protein